MDDKDIYRSAMVLINKYGKAAKKEAAFRGLCNADRLGIDGIAIWSRIVSAIEDIENEDPKACKH